jgi:signal transduction histidine kinase/DNA-binding response OmpR family regulator
MTIALITVAVRVEQDVVAARQRARQISALIGFDAQDQARVATAVSEIARNAFRYAGGGEIEFSLEGERAPQILCIVVKDRGRGIRNLPEILEGNYRSSTGMGLGITGARRLMDYCTIESGPGGTRVLMKKLLPEAAALVDAAAAGGLAKALAVRTPPTALDEVQQQNRELIRTLSELRERQDELLALNRELEDTNRGVVALYAELAERADSLRRADETKTRFLSNMSHEFRTPLNSMRALCGILLEQVDGPLNTEQETQVRFIKKAADDLADLVNDLLDLAKIEAGKIVVRPAEFTAAQLFSALRGMLRPLLVSERVALHFEPADALPPLYTDESKLSQILRNFISNALKYTEAGEIRVSARLLADGEEIAFSVADTGIGIAPEDQEVIFEEFEQVPNRLQARVKGTGLGLPLSRRLATVLGGRVSLQSALGVGSTFSVAVPCRYGAAAPELAPVVPERAALEPSQVPVLVVEDNPEEQVYYQKILRGTAYAPVQARTLRQAMDAVARVRPAAIVLDVKLGAEESWRWLAQIKSSAPASSPAVIVASAVDDPRKGYALGADLYIEKPVGRAALVAALNRLTGAKVLVIDDDPAARYAVRKLCDASGFQVLEAADAQEGLRTAALMQPALIVLDLNLPDRRGEDVLRELAAEQGTRGIPVVVATSEELSASRREALGATATAVLSKNDLDRAALDPVLAAVRRAQ